MVVVMIKVLMMHRLTASLTSMIRQSSGIASRPAPNPVNP